MVSMEWEKRLEFWTGLAQGRINKGQELICKGRARLDNYIYLAEHYALLGRTRALLGDNIGTVRKLLQEAARFTEICLRMAINGSPSPSRWAPAGEQSITTEFVLQGLNTALMAADLALAHRLADRIRILVTHGPHSDRITPYISGLALFLLGDYKRSRAKISPTLANSRLDVLRQKVPRETYALCLLLAGVIDREPRTFNRGLRRYQRYYKNLAWGEYADTAREYVSDDVVALLNLALYQGMKIKTRGRFILENLLINAHPPIT